MSMKCNLLKKRTAFKPVLYSWAIEASDKQDSIHWTPNEIPFDEDKRDWDSKLTSTEKDFLTQIFRFFTQADIDVAAGYKKFQSIFDNPELTIMMSSFAAMEGIHIKAYARLLETVGMPDSEFASFMEYKEMKDKHDYLDNISGLNPEDYKYEEVTPDSLQDLALTLAVYAAFSEGLQLFSSFIMLLNFQRFGKMKNMGQVIAWSMRDESLHVESMIKLFNTLIAENPGIWVDSFKKQLYDVCRKMVELEDRFVELAFKSGAIEGLTEEDVKLYVRYLADRRLLQLGLKPNYNVKTNPLPWVDEMLNAVEHSNFFEQRATEYSKGATTGEWRDKW